MDDLVKKLTSKKKASQEDIRKLFKNEGKKVEDAQHWLISMAEQDLKDMNDRQIGKIKWDDNAFSRYKGFDKEKRARLVVVK